jgi:hypothetical protein
MGFGIVPLRMLTSQRKAASLSRHKTPNTSNLSETPLSEVDLRMPFMPFMPSLIKYLT